jgi:DNA topoisomerase-3
VIGTFAATAGSYTGKWIDEKFAKANGKEGDGELRPERLWTRAQAEALRDKCTGKPGIVTEESKPSTQLSPLLYDLTTLQREANSRFGLPAQKTLSIAQALYERYKVLTYPRTDARALPEDYLGVVNQTLEMLKGTSYAVSAAKILTQGWVRPNKRIFNNAKISDHFAIIPTTLEAKHLPDIEQKIYDMVTKRFLAVFFPAAEFLETVRITRVEGEPFRSTGKVLVQAGWMEVYGKEAQTDDTPSLVAVKPGEQVRTEQVEVEGSQTKPPPRFSEATLLSAMEGAGKLIEDEELRAAMKDKGLGTPATRASIIEGLIREIYIERLGRELKPTAKAFSLITLLKGLEIQDLTRPELTGDWEFKLRQMARGQLKREDFMAEISKLTGRIVAQTKAYEHDTVPGDFGKLKTPCPKCGGEVHETYKKFQCQKCDFALWKIVSGRQFEPEEVEALIEKKQIGPLQGFRSKMGRPFAALIKLTPEFKAEFDFGDNDRKKEQDSESAAPPDFSAKEPLGKCPKCGARVFENGMHYICEKTVGPAKTCSFRATGKIILQQPLEPVQMSKLLETGKTDLLGGFMSKKTGRKFQAFLVLKNGEVSFEFPPRKSGKGARAGKKSEPAAKIDFTGQQSLGKCPRCGSAVFEGPENYVCERSQAEGKRCAFKVGKTILHQPVEVEQVRKLLATNKTDLLEQFISRSGRPFKAWLVMDDQGKVTFEFPER